MRIYIYCRVSTKQQADTGLSIDAQIMQGTQIAASRFPGVDTKLFIDVPVSGGTEFAEREAGKALYASLNHGDVVIATRLDRFFRDTVDGLLTANDLVLDRGVLMTAADFGDFDIQNPMRKMLFTNALAMAEFELAKSRERTRTAKDVQRLSGHYAGGYVPIGKEVIETASGRVLVDSEEDLAMLDIMRNLRGQKKSYRDISAHMIKHYNYSISFKSVERKLKNV
ncbi:recombinase family protein (plasmid) [Photobacterium sp. CCB-ST2H9]|uniref:recombinase family protein n=1 Tax=Photobacterium sp. CCB-ST2H9 TaxID=2912855 RepID=UPI002003026F|nr:recombinase family protein [Photobacterium sp. CCB-ST2H9]UTM60446.1 recombinase family protein [Photobacterium sp. CCB-ST2H9]